MDVLVEKDVVSDNSKKNQSQVASILSHHPLFDNRYDSHGIGYGLQEWSVAQAENAEPPNTEVRAAPKESEDGARTPAQSVGLLNLTTNPDHTIR